MAKTKSVYTCQSCGFKSPKWLGKCPDCNQWNSLVEEIAFEERRGLQVFEGDYSPQPITTLEAREDDRLKTGIQELDRVLGGGIVLGSATLIGGDPGIGKSTLLLQAVARLANNGIKVLYVSGEESPKQTKIRGERLGVTSENLFIYAENTMERILDSVKRLKPNVLVIDSIQTMYTQTLESSPGSVSQVRETSSQLIFNAKAIDMPIFLVGHVTKDGSIAGPRVLEHMVDTVLYFEGERGHHFRILRAVKNRYGSIMEIGVFEMRDKGLAEVINPSELFLAERPQNASGSVVVSSLEGTRPILVEIQSLVCPTIFGIPKRTVVGIDYNRVALLTAVLEKKGGLNIQNHDIFLKVTGGIRLEEPAIDLGIIASLASNFLDKPVPPKTIVFGEVGLTGEVRGISQAEPRINEAEKLGFDRCILPKDNLSKIKNVGANGSSPLQLVGVTSVKEMMDVLF
ncbi:MAG: DNA repair protein RadA [Deltaproteobacteria bacterium RIFCSPLOWO2_12_FULL_43_16]|nr:MAG: DNA repair protein RadA [Deltaproteobacteria bacterium GWA2_43_19]OGQ09441.1 MAG: DNA repair protein RadA [Deltaproteobacteria bacterium RIFCSPHIGHO2_02_FULL_43_33]OGQ58079.1 MAG: DNA repair protein RadA [Deltaproteobacteria bacterium RIFCSPLOWO2_12_FULL_43_16]HBR17454.1 DNA repair protein RadA [Deltaproteobacteria bacterium]